MKNVRFGSEAEVTSYRVLAAVSTSEMAQPRPAPTINCAGTPNWKV